MLSNSSARAVCDVYWGIGTSALVTAWGGAQRGIKGTVPWFDYSVVQRERYCTNVYPWFRRFALFIVCGLYDAGASLPKLWAEDKKKRGAYIDYWFRLALYKRQVLKIRTKKEFFYIGHARW